MTTPHSVKGQCYCTAIQFKITFPTIFSSHCHCEDCRKSHGAAFVTWVGAHKDRFEILSGENKIRKYESHPGIFWEFCTDCGTSLFYESNEYPDEIDVVVASLTGPLDRKPNAHVSFEEKVEWIEIKDTLPHCRGKTDAQM
jgi:hypothetical protein